MSMPYEFILTNLLAQTENAAGALFLDDSGETIELASSEFTPYQLRVLGAYLGIYLRQLSRVMENNGLGLPRQIHLEQEGAHVFAAPLEDGYSVVLVQRAPALSQRAEQNLALAAAELQRHLYA